MLVLGYISLYISTAKLLRCNTSWVKTVYFLIGSHCQHVIHGLQQTYKVNRKERELKHVMLMNVEDSVNNFLKKDHVINYVVQ